MPKRILVFPCGSEIGLEIHRSLGYSKHFELVGASSIDDHGRFVFKNYIGEVPYHDTPSFFDALKRIICDYRIDAIYPAMDAVAETIKHLAKELGVVVIGSSYETTAICASKSATYRVLQDIIPVPECYPKLALVKKFPIFIKPDRGYGARNTMLAHDSQSASIFLAKKKPDSMLLTEYLPGAEWTIDCFSDRHGKLRFHSARSRSRISNGISVNTKPSAEYQQHFDTFAQSINEKLRPRGAWFFQAKLDSTGKPKLLEVATRLGGSSGVFRCQGINFALLSAFDAFDMDVSIEPNNYQIEMDRALDNRYALDIAFDNVFVDLDDCLIIRNQVNTQLISFLYKAISEGKKVTLITRHQSDPLITLKKYRISEIFDQIIHIKNRDLKKSAYIEESKAIFIDDSFSERSDVTRAHGIPVFSPDMIEALI